MSADCYACAISYTKLANGTGTAGNPLGCCQRCQVFACGHHAHRDASVPRYICVQCDRSLLAASSADAAGDEGDNKLQRDLYALFPAYFGIELLSMNNEVHYVQSVEEFIDRRPNYGETIHRELREAQFDFEASWSADDNKWNSIELKRAVQSFPSKAQNLLAAAAYLTLKLSSPEEKPPPLLEQLSKNLWDMN